MPHHSIFRITRSRWFTGCNYRFNPLASIGGRLIEPGVHKSITMDKLRNSPTELERHVENGLGLACLTPCPHSAKRHSEQGGYDANDSDASRSHEPTSVVAVVDTSGIELLHIGDYPKAFPNYSARVNKEKESVCLAVLQPQIIGWDINLIENEKMILNPFYLSSRDVKEKALLAELEASFIEIIQLKADFDFNPNNPEVVQAYNNYNRVLITIAGGEQEFYKKLESLKTNILARGYQLDSNTDKIFANALNLNTGNQLLLK